MKKFTTLALAALIGSATILASISPADAQYRRHHHHRGGGVSGGAIAAGAILGIATGAIIAGSTRPAYAEPSYVYDDEPPRRCWFKKVRVYDEYNDVYVIERRRVCR